MKSTNYTNTLIVISPDSKASGGLIPDKPDTVAGVQYALISAQPYALTSDDVLFLSHARRKGIAKADYPAAREAFFSKPQACLRTSPLVKQFGWGIHSNAEGRVAVYGVETERYRELASQADIKIVNGMRSSRG